MRKMSARLSNASIVTKGKRPLHILPYERQITLVYRHEGWLVGDISPCTWNFGPSWPHSLENADLQSIFACSASAVTPSEKVQLIRIGNPLRAIQWADEQPTLPISFPKGGSKLQSGHFSSEIWIIICGNFETVRDRMSVIGPSLIASRALSRISPRIRVRVSVSIVVALAPGGYSWI